MAQILMKTNGKVGAVVGQSTTTLYVAGSIPARNQYTCGQQVAVPGLAVCINVCKPHTHRTPIIPSMRYFFVPRIEIIDF